VITVSAKALYTITSKCGLLLRLWLIIRYLAEFDHVQFAILHIGVMFAYQLADFMSRKLNVDNFQCLLQLHHRNEATPITINLTDTH